MTLCLCGSLVIRFFDYSIHLLGQAKLWYTPSVPKYKITLVNLKKLRKTLQLVWITRSSQNTPHLNLKITTTLEFFCSFDCPSVNSSYSSSSSLSSLSHSWTFIFTGEYWLLFAVMNPCNSNRSLGKFKSPIAWLRN